ncbi:bifunctional diaminohydroxyphosphoribosylaminopyrimidine deaminase/5-amino-6-(5-phosphoribosylamino)uracil reductase RibD [Mobilicoccus pelagius]|uniref:Riboflavin biosynthesis protein RibD n=1 Tax=Mobilicoccus pelagius NBRC 104925 TaxID=1089455 RepID=H5UUZ6_9MICO|nr:bifunctional diaminohydroxyphosphoribosylaminopyrimidine deaminase/5-amino-6-(5-phosphoribosylamino)uracil reductase RibD [Mobilicoccus pelagius]GAB49554.1 diaminohydroxyphosphoribosylaminopyrimidine deaminase/5-amino-6-(5-phosphoribosylamino)uracil reductase [Mobilicoccus pelagius NBRC 104925]
MGIATTRDTDETYLRRALDLAARGPLGDPNPRVGAVILDADGTVVGEGWHHGAGTPHAEAEALRAAGDAARGGTCYVTLEPCDHEGRTPACSQALLAAGIARVVVAGTDPHPVAGGGLARLRAAGVDVAHGVLVEAAEALNREWLHAVRTGRPFVTWKVASTLDGRIAAVDGTSRWITGPAARRDVHEIRARVGAVLVGTGTAIADDPALTVRDADGEDAARQPLRVVMGERSTALPADARLRDGAATTLLLPTRDPAVALAALTERGVRHVLLEGGGHLAAAFLREGFVDEVVAYLAPALLGAGTPCLADLGITTIGDAARLRVTDVRLVGDDVRLTATLERS